MKTLKTPFFMIDKQKLDCQMYELQHSLNVSWDNNIIGYSYKTNALCWVIRYMKQKGCYAEVVSDDEYMLAKAIGIEPGKIIYNGIAKSKETFLEAIKGGAIVNIDAEYEIGWLDELDGTGYDVGVRVNFDLESKCPGQAQGGEDGGRFGFCYENGELKRAIDKIQDKGAVVSGLHLHKSSKSRMPEIYKAIAETAVDVSVTYGLNLKYVDIGGGFFGGLDEKPPFAKYFEIIAGILRDRFSPKKTSLIVEPGISLVGAPVDYVTTVMDVKKTISSVFIITDGSRIHIDPLMTKSAYNVEIDKIDAGGREIVPRQIISGFTCMEQDRIFEVADCEALKPGDRIIYKRSGGYTMCLSPLFIKWFPDVYLKEKNKVIKIRDRWTKTEYMAGGTENGYEYSGTECRDKK